MSGVHISDYAGKRLHLVGIGGSSMSGLAEMLLHAGYTVQGSDSAEGYALARLRGLGMDIRAGHHPQMLAGADLLIYSAAISPADPERLEAQRLGIPQMERAVLLGQLMEGYRHTPSICGTHGKTTVSAMLSQVLLDCGKDPTVHIGGSLDRMGGGSRVGGKDIFVVEACEFNRSFLHMPPTMAIITNIEEDHLDCYKDIEEIEAVFQQFVALLPADGLCIGLQDDPRVVRVMQRSGRRFLTFSLEQPADWTVRRLAYSVRGCASFEAVHRSIVQGHVALQVAGSFNALHALAALAAAVELGCDPAKACASLSAFAGVHRRFEHTGTVQQMEMYHDYGHNPAEMRSAIGVAKMQGRRVIAVMQPHTYSRVKGLFQDYLTCTGEADITLVTDIYAAREADPGDIHSSMLVEGMRANGIRAHLTPTFDDTEAWLLQHGQPGDLVLTMGCGNINLLNDQMQRHWDQHHHLEG
ncbi:MAG: UDP-N-acetylmuramate--L-alanine ligase [Clostridiales bacterium]|nr:UDP-N-acetylmuramate--L-alanine ligase [Clostridiales bacterium]